MTSPIKPEIHNVSQRRRKRTEPCTATGEMHKNFDEVRPRGFRAMRVDTQTHSSRDTLHRSHQGRCNNTLQ